MARIIMADDGVVLSSYMLDYSPLGGTENAFSMLAQAFSERGHTVLVYSRCLAPTSHNCTLWRPLGTDWKEQFDLYIANRGDYLLCNAFLARCTVFWIHNPSYYLLKWRYLWKFQIWKPTLVFAGAYHASTYPQWAPGGTRVVIPHGLPKEITQSQHISLHIPDPRAIFISNPLRGLESLLDIWSQSILPCVQDAELHIFSGYITYGLIDYNKAAQIERILARAQATKGVYVHAPLEKLALLDELRHMRVMLYPGDANETFCIALAEAQGIGLPAVVYRIGATVERVTHGVTGIVAASTAAFAQASIGLLTNDALWQSMHRAALLTKRNWTWDKASAAFENLISDTDLYSNR